MAPFSVHVHVGRPPVKLNGWSAVSAAPRLPLRHGLHNVVPVHGKAKPVTLQCGFSDQKRAEKILEGMWIMPPRFVHRVLLGRSRVEGMLGIKCFLGQDQHNDRRTDKTDAGNDWRRLIDGGVNFVVGSLGAVTRRYGGHT